MSHLARTNPRLRGTKRALVVAALPVVLLLAAAVPAGASINTNLSSQGAQAPTDGCDSGTSTLSQANQSQQQVLKLLQDTNSSVETTAPAPEQQQTQQLSQANDDPSATTAPCPSRDDAAGLAKSQQRLSTGKKVNTAQDDPTGLSGQFVKPLAQCSYQDKGGVYRTVFGYDAKLKKDVNVPVGPKNILNPKNLKQNQVTTFSSGTHENAFIVTSKDKVQWSLGGQVVNGPVDTECQEHPVPVSGAVVPAVVLTLVAIPLVGWFFMSRKGKKSKVAA